MADCRYTPYRRQDRTDLDWWYNKRLRETSRAPTFRDPLVWPWWANPNRHDVFWCTGCNHPGTSALTIDGVWACCCNDEEQQIRLEVMHV